MSEYYDTPTYKCIFSTYPPQDDIKSYIERNNYDEVYVHIDFKNASTGLYVESVVENILENAQLKGTESTILQSLIYHLNWWKGYLDYIGINSKLFVFSDIGKSSFHRSIRKDYKGSRDITSTVLDYNNGEPIEIRNKNMKIGEKIINSLKDCYFILLEHLETDFIPYYLITRKFNEKKNVLHVICSNDKDMFQILSRPNTCMIYSNRGNRIIVTPNDVMKKYCKLSSKPVSTKEKLSPIIENFNPDYIPACMSITGDSGDDVPGVKSIAQTTVLKMFSDSQIINELIGSPEELADRMFSNDQYFKNEEDKIQDKQWSKVQENMDIVKEAYKLVSFEYLSRWFEDEGNINQKKQRVYIDNLLSNTNYISSKELIEILKKLPDLKLKKSDIENLVELE